MFIDRVKQDLTEQAIVAKRALDSNSEHSPNIFYYRRMYTEAQERYREHVGTEFHFADNTKTRQT